MKGFTGSRVFSCIVVLLMTAVLITLAVLQYRWSNQVSQATSERMEVDLEATLIRLRDHFYQDIAGFSFNLQINPAASSRDRQREYATQYQRWSRTAAYPAVVANVFVMQQDSAAGSGVLRLDPATGSFAPVSLASRFHPLQNRLIEISADLEVAAKRLQSADELRQDAERSNAARRKEELARHFPVLIDEDVPALAQAVYHNAGKSGEQGGPSEIDWIIVELNTTVINQQIFPHLVTQYFGGPQSSSYFLAVVRGDPPEKPVYTSSPDFPGQLGFEADENIRLFGPPYGPPLRGTDMILLPAYHTQTPDGKFHETTNLDSTWPVRIEPIHYGANDQDWQMLARHRKGSLEAAVGAIRRRNLAVSFAILLLLTGSMLMLVVSSRRAQGLVKLQMDFVAAVSHELRTPLTVISSAADNLTDGVVGNRLRVEQYGLAIKKAARQLIHLVEQVLMYGATRNDRHRYNMAPVTIAEIIDTSCANTACIIDEAGVKLDRYVDPKLPPVMGDEAALSHCLQNLITNAVKYGGEERWVGIRARMGTDEAGSPEIQISIEDRGPGIEPRDLERVFEPFYRSPSAIASQIRGTGLGLALARTIAHDMGGRLTVTSVLGEGSSFVLHLPISSQLQTEPAPQWATAVTDKGVS